MQIILREKIRNLGDLGQLVNVKPGYARNFLVPNGHALQATKSNLAKFEAERVELEKLASNKLEQAKARARSIEAVKISILANAGDGGKLFGSIGTKDIADAMTAQGVQVDRHEVRLPNGVIRELGQYEVVVHLHTDVEAKISVQVKTDGQSVFIDEELVAVKEGRKHGSKSDQYFDQDQE